MHTGIISFCDRIAYNIKCSDAKDWILDQLENKYQIRILQRHWFRLDEQQFKYVQQIPHQVCIRSNGNPYFLYFTRYEDVNQIMYIDKKVQPGYQKPRIIITKGQFADSVFENTLLEGEMVKDNKNQWIFLINDVIMYKGKYLKEVHLSERITYAHEMLSQHYRADPIMDVCMYHVKKYVPCNKKAIEHLIQFSEKLPYTNRGIYFVPAMMKYKPKLINFNDELIKTVYRKVKDCPEFMEKQAYPMPPMLAEETAMASTSHVYSPRPPQYPPPPPARHHQAPPSPQGETEKQVITNVSLDKNEKIIWLRKTEQPDVYDMYEHENSQHKEGIASVPGLATSKMLRAVFKNLNVATSICFLCKLDSVFQKWIPIKKM